MAATSRKLLRVAIALGSVALVEAAGSAQPIGKAAPTARHPRTTRTGRPHNASAPITVDASKTQGDLRTHHVILYNPVISQADLRITAARADATGLDFQNSHWTFTGDVHLSSQLRGNLQSDEAVVEFRDNQIQSAVATGHPAEFEQITSSTGVFARGHADNIQYAVTAGTIRLTKDAWLKYGDDEITGAVLVYNIKDQKLEGVSSGRPGERVHIEILPKKGAGGGKGPRPNPKAAPGSPPQGTPRASPSTPAGEGSAP
jgi:lipopolysaccharide export system protein LptA